MPPSVHPSILPSCYLLLNHWAEFNQTCYMISPHGKGVREEVIFYSAPCVLRVGNKRSLSVYLSAHPSSYLLLNYWALTKVATWLQEKGDKRIGGKTTKQPKSNMPLKIRSCGHNKSNLLHVDVPKICWMSGKQCTPWSGIWSVSMLIAQAGLSQYLG